MFVFVVGLIWFSFGGRVKELILIFEKIAIIRSSTSVQLALLLEDIQLADEIYQHILQILDSFAFVPELIC
jgi:hypothetical protein